MNLNVMSLFQGTVKQKRNLLPYYMNRIMEISEECIRLTKGVKDGFDGVLETTRELIFAALTLKGVSQEVKGNVTLALEHSK